MQYFQVRGSCPHLDVSTQRALSLKVHRAVKFFAWQFLMTALPQVFSTGCLVKCAFINLIRKSNRTFRYFLSSTYSNSIWHSIPALKRCLYSISIRRLQHLLIPPCTGCPVRESHPRSPVTNGYKYKPTPANLLNLRWISIRVWRLPSSSLWIHSGSFLQVQSLTQNNQSP